MRHGVLRSAIITLALTLASAAPLFAQSKTSLSGALSGREFVRAGRLRLGDLRRRIRRTDRPSAGGRSRDRRDPAHRAADNGP